MPMYGASMPFRRLILLPVLTCALVAQQAPGLAGHWEGPLQLPNGGAMKLTLDLKQDAAGLKGELGSPDQGAKTMAIANADMKEGQFAFSVPGIPGDAHALLKPSADGQRLEG